MPSSDSCKRLSVFNHCTDDFFGLGVDASRSDLLLILMIFRKIVCTVDYLRVYPESDVALIDQSSVILFPAVGAVLCFRFFTTFWNAKIVPATT